MSIFAQRIKSLRQERRLTQKQLAELIDASERGIQNYETQASTPTYEILLALAGCFEVSIDYLAGQTE